MTSSPLDDLRSQSRFISLLSAQTCHCYTVYIPAAAKNGASSHFGAASDSQHRSEEKASNQPRWRKLLLAMFPEPELRKPSGVGTLQNGVDTEPSQLGFGLP